MARVAIEVSQTAIVERDSFDLGRRVEVLRDAAQAEPLQGAAQAGSAVSTANGIASR